VRRSRIDNELLPGGGWSCKADSARYHKRSNSRCGHSGFGQTGTKSLFSV
jgi:hypothetical protein